MEGSPARLQHLRRPFMDSRSHLGNNCAVGDMVAWEGWELTFGRNKIELNTIIHSHPSFASDVCNSLG